MEWFLQKFVPNFRDTNAPAVRSCYGKLAGIVGIVCNILLFAGKLTIGTLSGSVSITADAINNLSDASAAVVTLVGFKMAEKPADADHPFGHARMEYVAGLVVAAMILLIGVELGQSSVERIIHPAPVVLSAPLVVVLTLSIGAKLWLALFNRSLGKSIQSNTLLATSIDCRNDVLTTTAVLLCTVVSHWSHLDLDGYVGLLVAGFIIWSGVGIAKDTIDPLLGQAPTQAVKDTVATSILSYPKVLGVHDMMIHDYGPGRCFATVHVEMDARENPLVCHDIIDTMERDFARHHNIHLVVHYDPVVTDNVELNRMRQVVLEHLHQFDPRISVHDFRMVEGAGHTNLVFDAVLPYDMDHQRKAVDQYINEKLVGPEKTYYAIITFDHTTFQGGT